MKRIISLVLFLLPLSIAAKVLLITHSYNRPDFIEIQHQTFKKLLHDDYELVVFNDAPDHTMMNRISAMCARYDIRCIRIPQEIHTRPYLPRVPHDNLQQTNIRHANCVQYSLDTIGFDHDGIVFILDSDMFLIRPFSISEYMKDKDIAAFIKRAPNSVYCLCPALCILSMNKLPHKQTLNFNCGTINGSPADSGGWTYYYLIKHPEVTVKQVDVLYSHQLLLEDKHINQPANNSVPDNSKIAFYTNLGFNDHEINFLLKKPDTFEFYLDHYFLHYRDGSNDTHQSPHYHTHKFQVFSEFINTIKI